MSKDITLLGADYPSVPAIQLPLTGGGTATFYDVDGSRTVNENGTYDVTTVAQVVVNVGTPEITISASGSVTQELQPNTVYHFTSSAITDLTITFAGTGTEQYHFDFISPATAVTLNLPSSVTMETPFSVEANTKYEVDIYQGYGVFAEWVAS